LDFAWSVILRQPELMNQRPDLVEILRWSLEPERWATIEALEKELVPSFFEWVTERAGEVARCLESLFASDQSNLYLPLGLVAGELFHERLNDVEEASGARYRFENYLNGHELNERDAAIWWRAACEVLNKREPEERERVAGQVDDILEGIRALPIAAAFSHSKQGFRDRWLRFAEDIDRLGRRKWGSGSRAVYNSLNQLREHALAVLHEPRLARAEMAARLAGYEANGALQHPQGDGVLAAARDYAGNDSFVDWARFSLSWGDPIQEVAAVYGRLVKRTMKSRIEKQIAFGERLCQWHADNEAGSSGLIPVESLTSKCIAPLASQRPILLLVMDGMNFPAFHQLSRSLERSGWTAQVRQGEDFPTRVLSVLPSITEVSRWSLFSGRVEAKDQRKSEVVAFRENPAFADVRSKGKPLLFTKSDLGEEDSGALSSKVRKALSGHEHRVVSIVINAIDDQLKTGGQLSLDWKVQDIGILPSILEAAAQGERLVVLTSDHGHIPEMENTRQASRPVEGEARYRYGNVSDESEREFTGRRIKAATGRDSVVLPVTETLRYGNKAAGYHGGACDLEAMIPLAVFSGQGDELEGYHAIDIPNPRWWDWRQVFLGDAEAKADPVVPAKSRAKKKKVANVDELPLFSEEADESVGNTGKSTWMEAFFKSPVFGEQEQLLGRTAPSREHLRKVLEALAANEGTMLTGVLGQAISEPSFRLQGILSRVARFMNVDSYPILEVDRDSDTVRLNRKLLASQFQIEV
jgi:hypothetical protein